MKNEDTMLEIHDLYVTYAHKIILNGVELSLSRGEILALAGPNGAGKSTLIRAVSGLVPVKHGCIKIEGQDITRRPAHARARLVAVVPQERSLPGSFSVWQTILLGRTPYTGWLGRIHPQDVDQAKRAMQLAEVEALKDRLVNTLSGGEVQRVILARAIAQDTPLLLLDEPITFMDLKHQAAMLNLLRRLAEERQIAILMVLHDLNAASIYAHRIALLHHGELLACGSAHEVLTTTLLSKVYETPVHIIPHPDYGVPMILPDGFTPSKGEATSPNVRFPGMIGNHPSATGLCLELPTSERLPDST